MQGWNLEAETEADTTQELKMFSGFLFREHLGLSCPRQHYSQWTTPPSSISNKKMPHRHAHRPIWCSQVLNGGSLFPGVSSLYWVDKNEPAHNPSPFSLTGPCPTKTSSFRWIWSAVTNNLTPTCSQKTLTLIFKILVAFARCLASKQEVQLGWWLLGTDLKSKAKIETVVRLSVQDDNILQPGRSGKLLYPHMVTVTYKVATAGLISLGQMQAVLI